jgi:hypothetical protein
MEYFLESDKVLKRMEITFQSGWFYPAKSRSASSPSPAKTKTWQGPSPSFCFFSHEGRSIVLRPLSSAKVAKNGEVGGPISPFLVGEKAKT